MADVVLAQAWVPPGGWEEGGSTFQHLPKDPVPRTLGHLGWDEGMGAQLKRKLEGRGGRRGESVYCGGSAGEQGWPGPRGRLLPAACPRGVEVR